jgi:hypothetical protein
VALRKERAMAGYYVRLTGFSLTLSKLIRKFAPQEHMSTLVGARV